MESKQYKNKSLNRDVSHNSSLLRDGSTSNIHHNDYKEIFDGKGLGNSGAKKKRPEDSDEDYSSDGTSSEEEEDEKLEAKVKEVNL